MAKAKKAHLVKASVLNAASDEKGANFYVIAAVAPEVTKDISLASFNCGACNTHFSALADSQPFCVTCGSEEVDVAEGEGALSAEDVASDEDLANVECSACGTHNIVTLETASALGTKMHCVTCGAEIEYMPPTEGEEVEEVDDVELTAEAEDDMDDDDEELTLSEDVVEEQPTAEAATKDDKKVVKAAEGEGDEGGEGGDAESAESTGSEEEEAAAEEVDEEVIEDDVDSDIEEATLASLARGDFSTQRFGDRIVAFVGGIPVGHLEKAKAETNAGVFHTTAFANAIKHTAAKVGAEKALAHFKFELATVAFPVKNLVESRVQKGVDAAQQEIASKIKDVSEDFRQALSIAAAGLNKGWFKGSQHVLKAALATELSAMGVRNPTKALDKVFAQYSDPYHKSLLEKANELLSKPVEFRNELAEAISDMNYQASDESVEEEDETVEEVPTEARLEGAGLKTGRTREKASLNVVDLRTMADDLRGRNGGRIFG